jgi:hypothetical protein
MLCVRKQKRRNTPIRIFLLCGIIETFQVADCGYVNHKKRYVYDSSLPYLPHFCVCLLQCDNWIEAIKLTIDNAKARIGILMF